MRQIKLPKSYSNFCSAPWMTTYIEPTGEVKPCCVNVDTSYGNLTDTTFNDILKGNSIKDFRKQFLNNKRPAECHNCWDAEKLGNHSLRTIFNDTYFNSDFITQTKEDGTYDEFVVLYYDIRPSNLCNFACLMCCSQLSSGFHKLADELGLHEDTYNRPRFIKIPEERFEEIMKYIDLTLPENTANCHFYFAGGEPLIMHEHERILNYLTENKFFDVSIRYNTNMSSLKFKDRNWVDVWKNFKKLTIDASIDSAGQAGEIQRLGSDWATTKDNLRLLKHNNINVTINSVITMLTYPSLLNTIDELEEIFPREYLIKNITLTSVSHPLYYIIGMTPKQYLDMSIIDKLDSMGYNVNSIKNHINGFVESDKAVAYNWSRLIYIANQLKTIKNVNINDILPWFDEYVKQNYNGYINEK
jgi:radical SAM protein with 4Fe4S-binding SPASM domain